MFNGGVYYVHSTFISQWHFAYHIHLDICCFWKQSFALFLILSGTQKLKDDPQNLLPIKKRITLCLFSTLAEKSKTK